MEESRPSAHLNWAGNYRYGTDRLTAATSVEEVQQFVRTHDRCKVLGTRHCFNGLADSTDAFLSLREMSTVLELDPDAKTVTVEGGITYGQLCPYLDQRGFALHNLASLPHISVAGACATGTHGSGVTNATLSSAVSGLEVVVASGDVLRITRAADPDGFQGMVVNLGALGVITRLTLDVQPAFAMQQDVYLDLPIAAAREHFEEIGRAGYSVSLFTDWQQGRFTTVWVKRRTDPGVRLPAVNDFYGARPATVNVHPIGGVSAEHCTEQMGAVGPWHERLPHFRLGFTPSRGQELQTEYFVARSDAGDAIAAVERLRHQVSPLLLISEVRTIDSDDLWMSPCYKRPSLAIHFTWKPDWASVRRVLPAIEAALSPFDVRPHWGKLFTMPPVQLRTRYRMCEGFKRLVARYDPSGKFRNAFLTEHLYG